MSRLILLTTALALTLALPLVARADQRTPLDPSQRERFSGYIHAMGPNGNMRSYAFSIRQRQENLSPWQRMGRWLSGFRPANYLERKASRLEGHAIRLRTHAAVHGEGADAELRAAQGIASWSRDERLSTAAHAEQSRVTSDQGHLAKIEAKAGKLEARAQRARSQAAFLRDTGRNVRGAAATYIRASARDPEYRRTMGARIVRDVSRAFVRRVYRGSALETAVNRLRARVSPHVARANNAKTALMTRTSSLMGRLADRVGLRTGFQRMRSFYATRIAPRVIALAKARAMRPLVQAFRFARDVHRFGPIRAASIWSDAKSDTYKTRAEAARGELDLGEEAQSFARMSAGSAESGFARNAREFDLVADNLRYHAEHPNADSDSNEERLSASSRRWERNLVVAGNFRNGVLYRADRLAARIGPPLLVHEPLFNALSTRESSVMYPEPQELSQEEREAFVESSEVRAAKIGVIGPQNLRVTRREVFRDARGQRFTLAHVVQSNGGSEGTVTTGSYGARWFAAWEPSADSGALEIPLAELEEDHKLLADRGEARLAADPGAKLVRVLALDRGERSTHLYTYESGDGRRRVTIQRVGGMHGPDVRIVPGPYEFDLHEVSR